VKSPDFDVVTFEDELWCVECLPDDIDENSDKVEPWYADLSFWTGYPRCFKCGKDLVPYYY
jgi:hypothetical protein